MGNLIRRSDAIRLAEQGQIHGFLWQFKQLVNLPSAEPEIIYCKDCKKHDLPPNCYYQGRYISVVDSCPLVPIRGLSRGHEFDYQYCAFGKRREDG